MSMMKQSRAIDKNALDHQLTGLMTLVEQSVRCGAAAHEVESKLFRGVLALGFGLFECYLGLQGDGDEGAQVTLSDGKVVNRQPMLLTREYRSVFGVHHIDRMVYAIRAGQRQCYVPLDARLQLPAHHASYLLQEWAQALAVELPFRQVKQILERILGQRLPVSLLERQNQAMAESVDDFRDQVPAKPTNEGEFIVVSADGKGLPIVKPPSSEESIKKHDHQRGPKPDRKRMAIVGTVYDATAYQRTAEQVLGHLFNDPELAEQDEQNSLPRPKPIAKLLRAALPTMSGTTQVLTAREPVFTWLGEQVQQRDPEREKTVVVIMDGQHCLWDDAQAVLEARPRVEILDLLHATSTLWDIVHLFYRSGSDAALKAMKLYTFMLLSGWVKELIVWFRHQADEGGLEADERQRLEKGLRYFENHQHRMHYDQYLAAGYPIASGVIEGACRHVVKDRMERSGMRWQLPSAQSMLDLRCVALNGQWDEFTAYRIKRESERLYSDAPVTNVVPMPLSRAA